MAELRFDGRGAIVTGGLITDQTKLAEAFKPPVSVAVAVTL